MVNSDAISFFRGAQLRTVTLSDRLSSVIQPFIQEVLDQLSALGNFGQAILSAAQNHQPIVEQFFELNPNQVETSFSLQPQCLFPKANPILALEYRNARYPAFLVPAGSWTINDEATLPDLQHLLYLCGQSKLSYDQICDQVAAPMVALLDHWIASRIVKPQSLSPYTPPPAGVFRLQHATLLYRTRTTGILIDPHLHSSYGLPQLEQDVTRAKLEGCVDAILISHSHYDHWHCPTLMMFDRGTPIVVPKVPRGSITCDDMQARISSLGFKQVIAVDWNSEPIQIGDMEVYVLPFYGEQPLVPGYDQPKYPELRNWGNTYLIRYEDYSSWCLVDSGMEPAASMIEVAQQVTQRFGSVDQIISNFQGLSYNSIGRDLSRWGVDIVANLLSNPQILALTNTEAGSYLATVGPREVAEICAIVGAKSCLPYADSGAELGQPSIHDGILIPQVEAELRRLGCPTQVIPWAIGDGYLPSLQLCKHFFND
ncbi:MAG: hypothetical protein V7L22_33165 [Nostoc sp.]